MRKVLLVLATSWVACTAVDEPRAETSAPTLDRAPTAAAAAAPSASGEASEIVAATEHFVFRSDFLLNLHDYLDWVVDEGDRQDEQEARCLGELGDAEKEGWLRALTAYRQDFGNRDALRNADMVALRYRLAGLDAGEFGERFREPVDRLVELLEGAAPGYRRCVWEAQDKRNREWVAAAVPLVEAHETELSRKLAGYFDEPFPRTPTPVSVVHYGTWYGANTVTRPHHIMIGGDDDGNQGYSALETVFHEVSHTMVSPRNQAVARALAAAASETGLEVSRGLWHGILFYTVGQTVRHALAEAGVAEFESFYEEVLPRAWPTFLGPLESEWQPYLDAEIGLDEAARRLLRRMAEDASK